MANASATKFASIDMLERNVSATTSKKLDILNQNFIRQGVEIFPMMLSIRILESSSLVFGSNLEDRTACLKPSRRDKASATNTSK